MIAPASGDEIAARARKLHFSSIVLDTHDDTTQLMLDSNYDLGARHDFGSSDIPRIKDGGMNPIFFSSFSPSDVTGPDAVKKALDQIDVVRETVRKHPSDLMLATTADQVREAHKNGTNCRRSSERIAGRKIINE